MDNVTANILSAQAKSMGLGRLSIWTVYSRPKDFPHSHVARRFEVGAGEPIPTTDLVEGELSAIREAFARCGLACLARAEHDDPAIVECWL